MKPAYNLAQNKKERLFLGFNQNETFLTIDNPETIEKADILISLQKVKKDWEMANENLNFATDDDLIESYIYEVKALQVKYDYFLKKAKEKKLIQNVHMDQYKF